MNIVIVGVGKFGRELTYHLSNENHNVTVIDSKADVIDEIVNQYDVKGYVGNGASLNVQNEAGVSNNDLLIATTANDETNMLCCLVAKKLGVSQTIARIRNPEYATQAQLMSQELGISLTLNPDYDTAAEISRILRFPSALEVDSFANGKVDLVEIKIEKGSVLANRSLIEVRDRFNVRILICAVKRGNDVIIPKGNFILKEDDYVYLTGDTNDLTNAFKKFKIFKNKSQSALIVGGSRIALYLARILLESGTSVKIIDNDMKVCQSLADALPGALIIHGDATNQKLLLEEGIEDVDSIITLTGMDEINIILSSFAKSVNKNVVVTKVTNSNYDTILKNVGLDSVISPRDVFSNNIIRYVRGMSDENKGSEFKTLHRIVNNKVEALEFFIEKETSYTHIAVKDLHIKPDFLLACIIRNNEVIIPSGRDELLPYDSVVIVTTATSVKDVADIIG